MKPFVAVLGGTILLGGGLTAADQAQDPYTDKGATLEIASASVIPEAGQQKIIVDKTQPKITLSKWDGEVALGVTYQGMPAVTTGTRPLLSKNVEWSSGNQKMEAVPLDATATMEDGGMEINIILNAPPSSNVFNFAIDGAENLDFFYQPELTKQDIAEGASRPENVVGSYAVYYKNRANHVEGQTNYATGKAYHIFRPLVTDTNGATTWADLSYLDGVLSVTVPQSFLDGAVYPVKVDPTFGYTTLGGSTQALTSANSERANAYLNAAFQHIAISGEQVTQMSVGFDCSVSGSGTVDVSVYSISASKPSAQLFAAQTITVNSISAQFFNTGALSNSISAGTVYVAAMGNYNKGTCTALNGHYDNAGGQDTSLAAAGALPSTWTETTTENFDRSIYATYTASAGATTPYAAATVGNSNVIINSNVVIP